MSRLCKLEDRLDALRVQVTSATVRTVAFDGRSADGVVETYARDATMTRTGVGLWQVRFAAPHPDGANYAPWLTSEEQGTLRDTPDVTIVQGTQNANGFDVQINTGDNGATADILVDAPWSWGVAAPTSVVTNVTLG